MHIVYIVGNRPQFIKLAILHKECKQYNFIRETIIHTGQHFSADMSDVFFEELDIRLPTINLQINSLSHVAMIGRSMEALEGSIKQLSPDLIVVFGDTNATLAGALTAKKLNIPVAHIEAGIRTFYEEMPEESNRYLTDRLSDLNFCCTHLGMEHLAREGFNGQNIKSKVVNSGDLMLDAFYHFRKLQTKSVCAQERNIEGEFILATLHRKQNIEDSKILSDIIEALNEIHTMVPVVCPVHPNTNRLLQSQNIKVEFQVLSPQSYLEMQQLLNKAKYVITDSGGLQREAFFAGKPTLILMEKPFWPEVIEHGNALCSDSKKQNILSNFSYLLKLKKENNVSIFGNGNAATIIINEMIVYFNEVIAKKNYKAVNEKEN